MIRAVFMLFQNGPGDQLYSIGQGKGNYFVSTKCLVSHCRFCGCGLSCFIHCFIYLKYTIGSFFKDKYTVCPLRNTKSFSNFRRV